MDDPKILFNGRLKLVDKQDNEIFKKVEGFMKENEIKTFAGAVKKMIEEFDSNQRKDSVETIKHIHYWIPVSKEDLPANILNGTSIS